MTIKSRRELVRLMNGTPLGSCVGQHKVHNGTLRAMPCRVRALLFVFAQGLVILRQANLLHVVVDAIEDGALVDD